MMRILLLSCFVLFPFTVNAFECVVERTSPTAKINEENGTSHNLGATSSRMVIDSCESLEVAQGTVRIIYADEQGYPQEQMISQGGKMSVNGGERFPPFTLIIAQLRRMLNGDVKAAMGAKRAFATGAITGFPFGNVLLPTENWVLKAIDDHNKELQIYDASNALLAKSTLNAKGDFEINKDIFKAGSNYRWVLGTNSDEFYILSSEETKNISEEVSQYFLPNGSVYLQTLTSATIYSDNDLIFDSERVLKNGK